MELTTLDLIAAAMDRPPRPLHWAILLHLPHPPTLELLRQGARSARLAYPSSNMLLDDKQWVQPADKPQLEHITESDSGLRSTIHALVDAPLDLTRSVGVQQFLITARGAPSILLTRVHHAVADLVGASLFLQHQLAVALGVERPLESEAPYHPPSLRTHPNLKRKSVYSYRGPSDALWHTGEPSSERRWDTFAISASTIRSAVADTNGCTYNDVLATCAMETYRLWNAARSARERHRIGLWLPTNIRTKSLEGFGNGTTRIRVYNRYADSARLIEKARLVRTQVDWSRTHGEWAVPPLSALERLPMSIVSPLLRVYFNRPWVDMGTGVFSHAERSGFDHLPKDLITNVELMGTIDVRHPCGIFAITLGDRTYITVVRDPSQMSDADYVAFKKILIGQLNAAVMLEG